VEDIGIGWNERGLPTDRVPLVRIVSSIVALEGEVSYEALLRAPDLSLNTG
jgi:hypothetical protein